MKPDAEEFRTLLAELKSKLNNRTKQNWLRFAFHFTDVRNAANILILGKILSREKLESEQTTFIDIASPEVIYGTDQNVKKYARLYFRPLTPTQYHMEGIRSKNDIWNGCHCPVPIFFLFDSFKTLTRNDSLFSEGNLAKHSKQKLIKTARELRNFNFDDIFHVGTFSKDRKIDIISRRNAEIVIPDEIDLEDLRFIYCRTAAEKETLQNLLPVKIRKYWASKILVATSADLFLRDRVYIERVDLEQTGITIYFSPDAKASGPFDLKIDVKAEKLYRHTQTDFYADDKVRLKLRCNLSQYEMTVFLDDNLAYAGKFVDETEIPF